MVKTAKPQWAKTPWQRITGWLTQSHYAPEHLAWQQRFMVQRLSLVLRVAVVVYLTFILLRIFRDVGPAYDTNGTWFIMAVIAQGVIFGSILVLRTQWGHRHTGWIFLLVSWATTLLEQVWATSRGIAFPGDVLWSLAFLTQATLIPIRWPLHLVSQMGVLTYYYGVNSVLGLSPVDQPLWDARQVVYLFWFCGICDTSVALYERLKASELAAQQALQVEKERSEQLLLNILPETIARQLMAQQDAIANASLDSSQYPRELIADHFADATILFADIVGFTELSSHIPATDVVAILNTIFSEFDELAERHQLEKIKTIGDAYMVVGGLPIEYPAHDPVAAIADMALDMQQAMITFSEYYERPLRIRIGINAGPVVAGVIGRKKFIYDLWGDAVNLASRMESHGQPDCIQVTQAVYERLCDRYHFQKRGAVHIKGKGELVTYWLTAKTDVQPSSIVV